MKFIRIFPETWAKTLCPFLSSTLNIAFGKVSTTLPSTTIGSSFWLIPPFLKHSWLLCVEKSLFVPPFRTFFRKGETHLVNISGSPSPTATVSSKCAESDPSFVTAVHPSSMMRTS